jgi:4-hydroxy-4-methyl-2-oxoglutarate aldolase
MRSPGGAHEGEVERVKYQIRTDFERPDPALVARAAASHVGVTGVHAGPRQVADYRIKPLDPAWRICGPAFTVRPEFTDDLLMGELAGKYAKPGDVIVVDAGGRLDRACWGMGMSTAARLAGCAGVVLDGLCMNGALLTRERVQLPVFARGLVASASGAERPGWLNVPVVCGGVIVHPGDIVLADCDGVVFLPRERAEAILERSIGYQSQAAADGKAAVPYFVRRQSDEKARALPDTEWL